jgi:acyl-CoA synthetase (AMP-forming)/AMP-acid ligase II
MIVPFNVRDFLDRAEVAYPDRIGLIDEPDQPAEAWGPLSFADLAARARAQAVGLDRLGIGRGERVAVVSHNSSRSTGCAVGAGSSFPSTSDWRRPRSSTSWSIRGLRSC